MEVRIIGRVKVTLNKDEISKAIYMNRGKHTPQDSILNYAADSIAMFGGRVRYIKSSIKMPDSAVVFFRIGSEER